ncbi:MULTISPECIES: MFS transporter [Cyanophyceae]|uniref:MFS transporter n=1 Tax=Leptolyngbya subtilissima DQ-A4 TaxID=2933933 RepID=A0ABV0K0X9_9CYAN|nr:MFS transporter [Nodosilinea sp. FACHB-141]MBD2111200.1 MFS transporter [Nodosilinea sp. FACHB-141]
MASADPSRLPLRFWIAALVAFINAVGFTLIIPLIYPYAVEFGLSDFQASLLTTAYAAAQFIATPILGRLSDRMGRKPLLIVSLLGTVAANLMAGLAPVAWMLFVARLLDGITGGNTSIAQAIVSDITTPEQRARAYGIFGAVFRLGFVVGPPLSYVAQLVPPLPGFTSLGTGFLFSAAIALFATALCLVLLPETLATGSSRFQFSWQDFGFGRLVRSATDKRFGRIFWLTFFSGFTFTIFTFAFQPFFLKVLGQDARNLAIMFAAVGMIGFVTQVFALEPLRRRFRLVQILAGALAARGILFLLMPAFPNIVAFVAIAVVFSAVNSFPMPLIDALLSLNSGPREQGEVMGLNASYLSISNAIGPATAGLLVSVSYSFPFWIAGALTLLTAWFAMTLSGRGIAKA